MDAVREKKIIIYFGGQYQEHWDRSYVLSVSYENRRAVEARRRDGLWQAVGGDAELITRLNSSDCDALTRQYFEASASVYEAVFECRGRGLSLDRLRECFRIEGNAVAAPELMRCLMDEFGMSISVSYHVAAHCCGELRGPGIDIDALAELQPRTANVLASLRLTAQKLLAVSYDSREKQCRSPFGAARCGESVTLGFNVLGGRAAAAVLELYGDSFHREYRMERDGKRMSVTFTAPEEPAALWYSFRISSDEGDMWLCADRSGYIGRLFDHETDGFRLTVYKKDFDTPEWFRKTVMYQIFPDRFGFSDDGTAKKGTEYHRALGQTPELHASLDEPVRYLPRSFESAYSPDDFYGGTFRGITEKLPYLKALGIGCIYLNPIVESRSNHRYDTSDYLHTDPILGSNEDFTELCRKARDCGIRIILDGVFSHTGADSVYFNRFGSYLSKGACQGEDSEYYEWYDFKRFPDEYRCWWGFKDLPEVDETNSAWRDFIISGDNSVVKTWLRRGASGWRLDVADELPEETLELIRTAVKAEKPDAPIIGEVWEDAVIKESQGHRRSYALGSSLDSVMNYPLRVSLLDFAHRRIDAYGMRDFLISQHMNYPKPLYYSLMNLLGSHDVDRVRTALATDAVVRSLSRETQLSLRFSDEALETAISLERLCATVQFALPGVPSIYYGDEQGMCGVCDPFNRLPFRDTGSELYGFYSSLAALRSSSAALSTGEAVFMAASGDILLILRFIKDGADVFGTEAGDKAFLAVINRGDKASFTADCSAAGRGIYRGEIDAMTARIMEI